MITTQTQLTVNGRIDEIKKHLKLIKEEHAQRFVEDVLNWYQWDQLQKQKESALPPNLFEALGFGSPVTMKIREDFDLESPTDDEYEQMNNEVRLVLNVYHMFYLTQCDASKDAGKEARHFNYYCKEVW